MKSTFIITCAWFLGTFLSSSALAGIIKSVERKTKRIVVQLNPSEDRKVSRGDRVALVNIHHDIKGDVVRKFDNLIEVKVSSVEGVQQRARFNVVKLNEGETNSQYKKRVEQIKNAKTSSFEAGLGYDTTSQANVSAGFFKRYKSDLYLGAQFAYVSRDVKNEIDKINKDEPNFTESFIKSAEHEQMYYGAAIRYFAFKNVYLGFGLGLRNQSTTFKIVEEDKQASHTVEASSLSYVSNIGQQWVFTNGLFINLEYANVTAPLVTDFSSKIQVNDRLSDQAIDQALRAEDYLNYLGDKSSLRLITISVGILF